MKLGDVAARIQHTNLRPHATQPDVERLAAECVEHGFDAAVVNPIWIPLAARALEGTGVRVCTALDVPSGAGTTATVVRATAEARQAGAEEFDVMTKVGWLRSAMDIAYRMHLAAVVQAAEGAPVKAVLETPLLMRGELALAVELCADAGVTFLENSSGWDGGTTTPEVVADLARLSRGRMKVKASGGIRTAGEAKAMFVAGAHLVGTTAGVAIMAELRAAREAEAVEAAS